VRVSPLPTEEIGRLVAAGDLRPSGEVLKAFRDGYDRLRFFGSQAFLALGEGPEA
jgi:hypothetical protein